MQSFNTQPMADYFKNCLEKDHITAYDIEKLAVNLAGFAFHNGYFLTIESYPEYPLAMGNNGLKIDVRPLLKRD